MKRFKCRQCEESVSKDAVGLNKKLLNEDAKQFFCLSCLADFLEVTTDDLARKIEEFKSEGCTLF